MLDSLSCVAKANAEILLPMTTYSVSHTAYLKLILHAVKYPHKVVNGGEAIVVYCAYKKLMLSSAGRQEGWTEGCNPGLHPDSSQLDGPQSYHVYCS